MVAVILCVISMYTVLICLLHFVEHPSGQSVSVMERRSLLNYEHKKLDLESNVSDLQFLEVKTVVKLVDYWICLSLSTIHDNEEKYSLFLLSFLGFRLARNMTHSTLVVKRVCMTPHLHQQQQGIVLYHKVCVLHYLQHYGV